MKPFQQLMLAATSWNWCAVSLKACNELKRKKYFNVTNKHPFCGKQTVVFSPELKGFRFVLPRKFPGTENFQDVLFPVELKIIIYLLWIIITSRAPNNYLLQGSKQNYENEAFYRLPCFNHFAANLEGLLPFRNCAKMTVQGRGWYFPQYQ